MDINQHDEKQGNIYVRYTNFDSGLPTCICPIDESCNRIEDLLEWIRKNNAFISHNLMKFGRLIFRNFDICEAEEFKEVVVAVSQRSLLEYMNRSTPRTHINNNIYTSTEYPPKRSIPLHNENSYTCSWPTNICFFCAQPAKQGGETPLADSRKVFERIAPSIREQFIDKQVMYVRNFGDIDISWQTAFQTENQYEVERYCKNQNIQYEWRENNHLRTTQVCQATTKHSVTGEDVWFNQAHLFHISGLPTEVRESMLAIYKEDELPRNSFFGDGSRIEASILDEIREAYRQETLSFPWQKGDILILDNVLVAHGRKPFSGERKVFVGMT
jgi:alpha-ketoglutarate-dependent taurine dioxygenase